MDEKQPAAPPEKAALIGPILWDKFLSQRQQKLQQAGVQPRHVSVFWNDVGVSSSRSQAQEGLPNWAGPFGKLFYGIIGIPEKIQKKKMQNSLPEAPVSLEKQVLQGVTGYAKPGEMVLVLGKPDSGASAFMRVVGLQSKGFKKVDGTVTLNGNQPSSLFTNGGIYASELVYSGDDDVHAPTLTVDQTLDFALQYKVPKGGIISPQETKQALIDWLGLEQARHTIAGNEFIRGISGGEKKRLTIAELVAADATVQVFDQTTKGLDSTYALVLANGLRSLTTTDQKTTIAYFNQAGDSIYSLFDKVLVLAGGREIYFGPADQACEYFESMGFLRQHRQSIPDFLTQVTEVFERQIQPGVDAKTLPVTPHDFELRWKSSPLHQKIMQEMQDYQEKILNSQETQTFSNSALQRRQLLNPSSNPNQPYIANLFQQYATTVRREFALLWGARQVFFAKILYNILIAAIVAGFAFQLPWNSLGAFARTGSIFFALLISSLATMSDVPMVMRARPTTYKHKRWTFYHPSLLYMSQITSDTVQRLSFIIPFALVYYWMVGFTPTAAAFFTFIVNMFVSAMSYSAMSKALCAMAPDLSVAMRLNGMLIVPTILFTGYLIPVTQIPPWFIWLYYLNPLAYSYKALMVNEFVGNQILCDGNMVVPPYPNVPMQYKSCSISGSVPGQEYVNGAAFIYTRYGIPIDLNPTPPNMLGIETYNYTWYIWWNFLIVLLLWAVYVVLAALVTEYVEFGKGGIVTNVFKKGHLPKNFSETYREKTAGGLGVGSVEMAELQAIGNGGYKGASGETGYVNGNGNGNHMNDNGVPNGNGISNGNGIPNGNGIHNGSGVANDVTSVAMPAQEKVIGNARAFTWSNVCYYIPNGKRGKEGGERQLLDNVSGFVLPGNLVALIGFTGAGKTTLQDVLCRRKKDGRVVGDVFVGDYPQDESFRRISAYAPQQDVHRPTSTVREALRFSAYLRQPAHVSKEEKDAYVEEIIDLMGLREISEAMVGDVFSGFGISLVDRKRLAIGIQLVAKPEYLILDEPTSALDSYAAFQIVKLLRHLADQGQAILCTIHQPSTLLFEMFDKVLLIGNRGTPLYFGDIGPQSRTVIDYFERNGATACGPDDNPAEYVLDAGNGLRDSEELTQAVAGRKGSIISLESAGLSSQSINNAKVNRDWGQIWRNSPENTKLTQDIAILRQQISQSQGVDVSSSFALNSFQQFPIVFQRFFTGYCRLPDYQFGRIAIILIQGLFSALAFLHAASQPVSFQGAIQTMFVLFNMVTFGVALINFVQTQLIEEKEYFLRESAEGFYDWKSFTLSLILAEIPFSILTSTIFWAITYFAVGLRLDMLAPLVAWLTICVFQLYCVTFGQSVAAMAPSLDLANLVASFVATIFPSSSGVPTPYNVMNPVFRILYYFSPYNWTMGVLATTQYHNLPITCSQTDLSIFPPPPGTTCGQYLQPMLSAGAPGYLLDPSSTTMCQYCPISNGDAFIKYQLNLEWDQRWRDFGILCLFLVFNWFMLFVWFWLRSKSKKKKQA